MKTEPMNFPFVAGKNCSMWADVGSRVTCNPAPTDTDRDILILLASGELCEMADKILEAGGEQCGEDYGDDDKKLFPYRLGDDNYLLTESVEYFNRFMAITALCKHLNVMEKQKRKDIFSAAMDGAWLCSVTVNYAPMKHEDLF